MRAFDPDVVNALWAAIEPLIPVSYDHHPLGCHRPRKSDRSCFEVILVRLVTGCSWEDAEHLTGRVVSDTTARLRRDEWIGAGVFDVIASEAVAGYDSVVGLDLREVAVDGSLHKAPAGGKERARVQLIEASSDGSGPSPPTLLASPSAGASDPPTAMTSASSLPPSKRLPGVDCSVTWTRCGSTEVMTGRQPATG